MWQRYITYLRNNPKGYWFKRKLYGWGWVPATWQGWLVILIYILLLVHVFNDIDKKSHSASDTLYGIVTPLIALTILLLLIAIWKGEKPRWQWGYLKKKK